MIAAVSERATRVVGTFVLAFLASTGCNLCGNEELSRIPSPDGKLHAVVFLRDCGATTGFSTQVSLVDAGQDARGQGSLFIADCRECDWSRERPYVEATWTDSGLLTIRADRRARIFKTTPADRGVQVILTPVARPAAAAIRPRQ